MKPKILLFLLPFCYTFASAQKKLAADSGSFILHTFENPVGRETYQASKLSGRISFHTTFSILDRGIAKTLNAELQFSNSFEPLRLTLKKKEGATFFTDSITTESDFIHVKTADTNFTKKRSINSFFATGYAPVVLQQELLNYWFVHGRPTVINILPQGTVCIKREGTDKFILRGRTIELERYTINGLVWGNEFLWTDSRQRLIGLITNNEVNDKVEAMRVEYEPLLKTMVSKVAYYGTEKLAIRLPTAPKHKLIAITGARLIDVTNGQVTKKSVIIINGNKIVAIGVIGSLKVPLGAQIIDARGKTVIPGLWDMHAHYGQAEWGPAYLAAGVTTVRDCTDEFEYAGPVKKLIDAGQGIGPRILKAGLIDGDGPGAMGIVQAGNRQTAIQAVRRFARNGYAQIKIFSTVKPAIVKIICAEAHRLGLTVTGHIPDGMTLQAGVDSGMDMVNHIYYVYAMMKYNKDHSVNFGDSTSEAAMQFLKNHQVVIDPTLGGMEMSLRSNKDDINIIEPAFNTLPLPLQTRFAHIGMNSVIAEKYKPMYHSMIDMVKVLYDAGIPIVAGSDVGIPGLSLNRELELYVQAGLTPLQAIQAATVIPAKVMQMYKSSGTAAAGKQADLVILDANPLDNIRNLRHVFRVIHEGKIYEPQRLHKLAGFSR